LSRIALAKGKYADATALVQRALDQEPLGFVPNFYFGVCALRQKKYEQALQAFSFCAGQNPCAECFLLRGQTQAALGDAERALKDLNIAVEKNPQLASAFQLRGAVHRELGHAEEAVKDFDDARRLSE
jgi:tetratricopeptide (TPR) repeat protein